jgi:hypothetical protein
MLHIAFLPPLCRKHGLRSNRSTGRVGKQACWGRCGGPLALRCAHVLAWSLCILHEPDLFISASRHRTIDHNYYFTIYGAAKVGHLLAHSTRKNKNAGCNGRHLEANLVCARHSRYGLTKPTLLLQGPCWKTHIHTQHTQTHARTQRV